jgi:hypothetical protein
MSIASLTADQILAIPATEPERLFSGDPAAARREYRELASTWHPDRNHDAMAGAVFDHVAGLYRQAEARLASGTWIVPGLLTLTAVNGQAYTVRYRRRRSFELGEMFIGRGMVTYVLAGEYGDLWQHATRTISGFRFAGPAMRAEVARYLPEQVGAFKTPGAAVLVVKKAAKHVLLRDMLEHLGGTLAAEHVAWILSSLLNLACYLHYAGLTHNAISLDTYFVAPSDHSGALLGGWWYAADCGARLTALPAPSLHVLPPDMLAVKRADSRLDLDLIRSVGWALLGDERGVSLGRAPEVPAPLRDWLRLASSGDAVQEYDHWQRRVLIESFGPRRFVPLHVSADAIYS